MDLLSDRWFVQRGSLLLIEDGIRLCGIAGWLAYFVTVYMASLYNTNWKSTASESQET